MDRFTPFDTHLLAFMFDASELDRELAARLVEEAAGAPGLARSNVGGWHSVPDLSQRPDPCYRDLMQRVIERVEISLSEIARARGVTVELPYRFGIQAWGMVMREGDYVVLHDHAQAHFSVVYYPDAGDADLAAHRDSGKLTFVDPRRGGTSIPGLDLFPTQFSIAPQTGMLVVFPGWLQHFVHAYRGERPRVSISCNIRLELDGRR